MYNVKFVSAILFVVLFVSVSRGQPELQKIIPLTPNAASIEKYTETPISYFTGTANVSIPIYNISSRSISLPLSLSYHSGGNKVEDLASWVGLGWSLVGVPSISRRINGLADDSPFGFFTRYHGRTAKKMYDSVIIGGQGSWDYIKDIHAGVTDTEADIFSFSLLGKSGKFFWDQETSRFYTTPHSNIKVEFIGGDFKITDDDGTVYFFGTKETSTIGGAPQGNITTWLVDKIRDGNATDSLIFSYSYDIQVVKTLNTKSKLLWGSDCSQTQSIMTTNNTGAYSVSTITFANGYVQFIKESSVRQDLNGGYALKNIKVLNNEDYLVKDVEFSYHYRGSGTAPEDKRLMLDYIVEKNGTNEDKKHLFSYESTIESPSRLSFAQDYWGYYNGAIANTELIPTANVVSPAGPIQVPGANRDVNPGYTQFAILKRIQYPTGGYSEIEYENNQIYSTDVPRKYIQVGSSLTADEQTPPSSFYSTTFQVNNPPDIFLNNNLGGANVSIQIGGMNCIGCSSLTLQGLDAGNSHINTTISYNLSYYLPNGNYRMTANFGTQPPEDFENFYYIISWFAVDPVAPPLNSYVGGLRIKKISSYDGLGGRVIKRFRYTTSPVSDTSSGDAFGKAYFLAFENYTCIKYLPVGGYTNQSSYRMVAGGGYSQVSHSGSFSGYKTVYEFVDSLGSLGANEYKFTYVKDVVANLSPFPPPASMEIVRGQLKEQNTYRNNNGILVPLRTTRYEYRDEFFDNNAAFSFRTKLTREPVYANGDMVEIPQYDHLGYENIAAWSQPARKTEITYDQNDPNKLLSSVTDYEYNDSHYYRNKMHTKGSDSKIKSVISYYPSDLSLSSSAETARLQLITQNRLSEVLKEEVVKEGNQIKELKTNYKQFGNIVMPEEVFQKIGNGPSESMIRFLNYDSYGNLSSQQKTHNIIFTYLWDYNSTLPIAEVQNANTNDVAYTSFEADGAGNWTDIVPVNVDATTSTVSGSKSYNLTPTGLKRNGLNTSTSYVVTYWSKNGAYSIVGTSGSVKQGKTVTLNGHSWTFYEHLVSGQSTITISGTGKIDELRLYPKGALMTTYTYRPLIGITSVCDANDIFSYYEYDGLNRLQLIRDFEGNVLKTFEYKYQEVQQ